MRIGYQDQYDRYSGIMRWLAGHQGCWDVRLIREKLELEQLKAALAWGAKGVITGGMIPKVEACRDAIRHRVPVVHMLNGRDPGSMVRKLIGQERIGTTVTQG